MSRRAFTWCLLIELAALTSCKTNQGNGEAQPEDTKHGYNPDNEKNNVRKAGSGGAGGTNREQTKPGPDQTPGQPASKTDRPK